MEPVRNISPFDANLHSQRSLIWAVVVSVVLHVCVAVMMFGLPDWAPRHNALPAGAINVSLVSVDDLGGPIAAPRAEVSAPPPAPEPDPVAAAEVLPPPEPKSASKPEVAPPPPKTPKVSVAPKQEPLPVKEKISLKKKDL